jgi:hypothetical protein
MHSFKFLAHHPFQWNLLLDETIKTNQVDAAKLPNCQTSGATARKLGEHTPLHLIKVVNTQEISMSMS